MTDVARLLAEAEEALQENEWDRALDRLDEALRLAPDHQLAARLRREAQDKKARDLDIRELLVKADDLVEQGHYRQAITIYDRAQGEGAQANILGHHAKIEQKRDAAGERQRWQERLDTALQEMEQHFQTEDWQAAQEVLEPLLADLRSTTHQDLVVQVEEARARVISHLDNEDLLDQAEEAFGDQDFEVAIDLVERVMASGVSGGLGRRAEQIANQSRHFLDNYINPGIDAAQTAYRAGRLDDAAALLYNLRRDYPQNPTWQRMWLTVYVDHGHQQLDAGRQANVNRDFSEARRAFTEAKTAFGRVLEVYEGHPRAGDLETQANELQQVATLEEQAQLDWREARREEACGALQKARVLLDEAADDDREYLTVSATVDAMLNALQAEIERIREEKRLVRDGQRLLGERRLEEAAAQFRKVLDALEPDTARAAQEGLNRVEVEQQAFAEDVRRAQAAAEPAARAGAYQRAFARWPAGPDMPQVLLEALVHAAETALNMDDNEEATNYANRALALDAENRRAHRVLDRVEKGPAVRQILADVNQRLVEIEREPERGLEDYEPIVIQLKRARDLSDEIEDLNEQSRELLGDVQGRQKCLRDYQIPAAQAETLRRAGNWEEAVETLAQAVELVGELPLSGPRERLVSWRDVAARLAESRETAKKAYDEGREAYEATLEAEGEGHYDFATVLGHLDRAQAALDAAHQVTEDLLPPEVTALERQVADLYGRAKVAQEAWDLSVEKLPEAVKQLRAATMMRPGDPVLDGLKEQLEALFEDRAEEAVADFRRQARTALDEGDIGEAVEFYRQALELQDTPEIRSELRRLQQAAARESELRELELDYLSKLETDSKPDALTSLAKAIRLLASPESGLPEEARRAGSNLLLLEKYLDRDEEWTQARQLLKQISDMAADDPGTVRLYDLTNRWCELGRLVALEGVIASAAQLGELKTAYRAATQAIRADPRNETVIGQAGEIQKQLVNSLDQSANKRLARARELLAQGSYRMALENLDDIETQIYGQAEQEFEGLLLDHDEAERVREEAQDLADQADRLQAIAERVSPLVEGARQAYLEGNAAETEELLRRIEIEDPRGEAVALKTAADDLRRAVENLDATARSQDLEDALNEAETQLTLAREEEDFQGILDHLAGLNMRGLSAEQKTRRRNMLQETRDALQAFSEGKEWLIRGREAMAGDNYEAAVRALERGLQVARSNRVEILTLLEEASEKRDEQRKQTELLDAGKKLLAQAEYLKAQQHLAEAQALGADVGDCLRAARAGVLLTNGRQSLQEGEHALAAMDLEEATELGQDNELAVDIVSEARRLLARVQREQSLRAELQTLLAEARLDVRKGEFGQAQDKAQEVLSKDAANRDAQDLLIEIEDTRRAEAERAERGDEVKRMYGQALEALEAGRYNDAQAQVIAIQQLLPDYPKAIALSQRIASEREAGEALDRAQRFARDTEFAEAEKSWQVALQLNPSHPRLDAVKAEIRTLQREWEEDSLRPIRHAYRDERYDEALKACRQALSRSGTPEFLAEVENLQQDVVNRWTKVRLQEAERLLKQAETVEDFQVVAKQAQQMQEIEPPPTEQLASDVQKLWRGATKSRLRKRLTEALARSDASEWPLALSILDEVDREAAGLKLGRIEFEATETRWQVENAQEQAKLDEREARLEEATAAFGIARDSADLRRVLRLVEDLLTMEGAAEDERVQALGQDVRNELQRYEKTQKALEEADRHLRGSRFDAALNALARPEEISPLLQEEYDQLHTLIGLLDRAGEAQDSRQWEAAIRYYSEALALDKSLANALERDVDRCRSQLWHDVQEQVGLLLEGAEPDPQAAKELLDEAEEKEWVPEVDRGIMGQLQSGAESLIHVAEAVRLLNAGKPPAEALDILAEAQRLAPQGKVHPSVTQWEHLALGLQAFQAGEWGSARSELDALSSLVADSRLARRAMERLSAAEETEQAVQTALQRVRDALAARSPCYEEAVPAAHELRYDLAPQDPQAIEAHDGVRSRLEFDLDTARSGGYYDDALKAGDWLARLVPEDEDLQRLVRGLPEERSERLEEQIHLANSYLKEDHMESARSALALAERIDTPRGDKRLGKVAEAIDRRATELQTVDEQVTQARRQLERNALPRAVEAVLEARSLAPHYENVAELIEQIKAQVHSLARARMAELRLDEAEELCELALRLGPDDTFVSLHDEIREIREDTVQSTISEARRALDSYNLDVAERAIDKGLRAAPTSPELLGLREKLAERSEVERDLISFMESGWERLKAKDFEGSRQEFRQAIKAAPDFGEGRNWLAYADNVAEGIRLVMEGQEFARAARRLEAAQGQLLIYSGEQLPTLRGGAIRLRRERRQAAFEAFRLAKEAREMAYTYDRIEELDSQQKWRQAQVLLNELKERIAGFDHFVATSESPPEGFDIEAGGERQALEPSAAPPALEDVTVEEAAMPMIAPDEISIQDSEPDDGRPPREEPLTMVQDSVQDLSPEYKGNQEQMQEEDKPKEIELATDDDEPWGTSEAAAPKEERPAIPTGVDLDETREVPEPAQERPAEDDESVPDWLAREPESEIGPPSDLQEREPEEEKQEEPEPEPEGQEPEEALPLSHSDLMAGFEPISDFDEGGEPNE